VTLSAVIAMTRYAEPQHHHATARGTPGRRPDGARLHPAGR
jgi:hypothetical protein